MNPSKQHTRNRKAGTATASNTNRDGGNTGGFDSMFTAADAPDAEPDSNTGSGRDGDGVHDDDELNNIFADADTPDPEPEPDTASGGGVDADAGADSGGLGDIFTTADTPEPDAASDDDAGSGGLGDIFAAADTPEPDTAPNDADAGTDVGGLGNIFATSDTPDPDPGTRRRIQRC